MKNSDLEKIAGGIVDSKVTLKKGLFSRVITVQRKPEKHTNYKPLLGAGLTLTYILGSIASAASNVRINSDINVQNDSKPESKLISEISHKGTRTGIFRYNGKDYTSTTTGLWVPINLDDNLRATFFGLNREVNNKTKGTDHDRHYKFILQPTKENHFNYGWGDIQGARFQHFGYDKVGENSGFAIAFLDRRNAKDELRGYIWKYDEASNLFLGIGKYNEEGRLVIGSPSEEGFGIRGMLKYNFENYKLTSMMDFTTGSRLLTKKRLRGLIDDDLHHSNSFGALEKENPLDFGPRYVVPSLERSGHGINGRILYSGQRGSRNLSAELLTYLGNSPFWVGGKLDFQNKDLARKAITAGYNNDNILGFRGELYKSGITGKIGGRMVIEAEFNF